MIGQLAQSLFVSSPLSLSAAHLITASMSPSLSPANQLAEGEAWLAYACALVILLCLTLYTLTGGADFGGGALSLFAPKETKLKAKWHEIIDEAIAPIWESNHVWLIVAIVVLFVCFPTAFSWVSIGLHLPLALLLVGVTLRGAAFVFAHYDPQGLSEGWRRTFRISSALTPLSLGLVVGSLAGGGLGEALKPLIKGEGQLSISLWWSAWLNPFSFAVALMTLSLFMWLAAIYLYHEAKSTQDHSELAQAFKVRAFWAQGTLAFSAALSLATAHNGHVVERLMWSFGAPFFHAAVAISAVGALWALKTEQSALARFFGAAQAVGIVAGWGVSSLPDLIPGLLSVTQAAAPASTLKATLICVVIALSLVIPAIAWLFRIFKRSR